MSKTIHLVDQLSGGEWVGCPLLGCDVELHCCLGCSRLEKFESQARLPYVVCESNRTERQLEGAFGWNPFLRFNRRGPSAPARGSS